ncbi:MAG: hypothetical protein Ct9H90mP13_05210 [Pseudomonadota bacterium]|nr:MAG: hypothetical protein Ct9H90mP13_05210 [Pseudomonadota bacterium]
MSKKNRTHLCEDIDHSDIGKQVSVSGWGHEKEIMAGIFIDLRDVSGILQFGFFTPKKRTLYREKK